MTYSLADFDFALPDNLIAQRPAEPRDSARLLVYDRASQQITDSIFSQLPQFLPPDSTLVLNNSRVEKCRLRFENKEIFMLETLDSHTVRALVKPGPSFKLGRQVTLTEGLSAEVKEVDGEGIRTLRLNVSVNDPALDPYRLTPLPPYIQQDETLAVSYQTVYADKEGSKAAPTAGLHFTSELLQKISHHHPIVEITLEVGLGTFAPVKNGDLSQHQMHQEWFEISLPAAKQLNQAQSLIAVGTTSARTLESAVKMGENGRYFASERASTDIFMTPGFHFRAVDGLITNFHLPKSTLLMLVAAFIGYEPMRRLYQHAITQGYQFYSFGDAMLLL